MNDRHLSKFLSLVLRHKPETIDLTLDKQGWADIGELLEKMEAKGMVTTFEQIAHVVYTNDKQRFALDEQNNKIRARQGHSVDLEMVFKEATPPERLYHGTLADNVWPILDQGILKMQRHHVHLYADEMDAYKVGKRKGTPVVLKIDSGLMVEDGIKFFLTENGVWLTEFVDPEYIQS